MQLNDTERQLLGLLREREAEAQRASQERLRRFLAGVAERTGIPVAALVVNAETGEITDTTPPTADTIDEAEPDWGHASSSAWNHVEDEPYGGKLVPAEWAG